MVEYNKLSDMVIGKSSIDGAISPISDFAFTNRSQINDYVRFTNEIDTVEAFLPVDGSFTVDKKNNLIIGEDGAVFDAFDLNGYTIKQVNNILMTILVTRKYKYPLYEFSIKEGSIPINISGSHTVNGEVKIGITSNMSTHILYLTNYKDFLPKKKKVYRK